MFTPSLGLFESLHHGRLASISVVDGQRIFDNSLVGLPINFSDAWQPLKIKDIANFPDLPVMAVLIIFIIMVLLHIFATALLMKIISKHPFGVENIIEALRSFISPPLHLDWELFYRQDIQNISVLCCWKR